MTRAVGLEGLLSRWDHLDCLHLTGFSSAVDSILFPDFPRVFFFLSPVLSFRLRVLIQEMHDLLLLPAAAGFASSAFKRTATGDHVGVATSEPLDYDDDGDIFLFDSRQRGIQGACYRRLDPFYLVPRHRAPFLTRLTELLRVWLPPKVEGQEVCLQGFYYGEEEKEDQGLIEWLLERWTSARCSLQPPVPGDLPGGMSSPKTRFSDICVPRWTVVSWKLDIFHALL